MGMFNHLIDDPYLEPEHVVQYFDLFNGYHDGAWAIFEDSDTGGFSSLHEVLICLANLRPNDFPDMDETCRSSIENLLKTEVEEIGEDVAGLCLICVRKGLVECDSNHDVTSS